MAAQDEKCGLKESWSFFELARYRAQENLGSFQVGVATLQPHLLPKTAGRCGSFAPHRGECTKQNLQGWSTWKTHWASSLAAGEDRSRITGGSPTLREPRSNDVRFRTDQYRPDLTFFPFFPSGGPGPVFHIVSTYIHSCNLVAATNVQIVAAYTSNCFVRTSQSTPSRLDLLLLALD